MEKIPNDDENSCAKNLWKMQETCKDEKESDEASWSVIWIDCDKRFLMEREFIAHYRVYHELEVQ